MTFDRSSFRIDRRTLATFTAAGLAASHGGRALAASRSVEPQAHAFMALRDKPIVIGMLIFPKMDQIDFTGPFAVLARLPNAQVKVIGTQSGPFADHLGMILTPQFDLSDAPPIDLLVVTGGPGQEALMKHQPTLSFIRTFAATGKPIFSVCTGALVCGAAGILKGRRATTHWSAVHLLPYFGATTDPARVVIDKELVTAAGLTAGIDGALQVAAMLRGEEAAQRIQLDIQYAPEPPFDSGAPETANPSVLAAVKAKYQPTTDARQRSARKIAAKLGIIAAP